MTHVHGGNNRCIMSHNKLTRIVLTDKIYNEKSSIGCSVSISGSSF